MKVLVYMDANQGMRITRDLSFDNETIRHPTVIDLADSIVERYEELTALNTVIRHQWGRALNVKDPWILD